MISLPTQDVLREEKESALPANKVGLAIDPLSGRRAPTGAELALTWASIPRLGEEEAESFESDIAEARAKLQAAAK